VYGTTFDDVPLVPALSKVLPRDSSLATHLTRNIAQNLPLVSAAMDTVTEARLAIAIAQEGGIGIVHKNLTAARQAAEVARVKSYESGILRDPIIITPGIMVRQVKALSEQYGVSGFPVVDGGCVAGIVTGRDLRFETRMDVPVRDIMTPRERLVTVREGASIDEGKALMHRHKLERVLVVNDAFELRGLMTVKDITKQTKFPNAARDAQGKLRVGAAGGWVTAPKSGRSCWSRRAWTPPWWIPRMATAPGLLSAFGMRVKGVAGISVGTALL
jgi:IMP dehydrogenase